MKMVNVLWHEGKKYKVRCVGCGVIFGFWRQDMDFFLFDHGGKTYIAPLCMKCHGEMWARRNAGGEAGERLRINPFGTRNVVRKVLAGAI
jgi:hypothetical protein